ncbi:hypothetical protein [Segetibacter aerophilus]|uniref:Uncharacterized protein n=1 Tax=Segetibacter aerophilus TaxID=670293 RepID=A0A512B8J3_9BACT|nr:hypothetical protein [Segetibacter aerophilus]GEO08273.1 hypothetical protein SAE01_07690 [Segetibacter aerophilus]
MNYLTKEKHDIWLKEEFPKLQISLYSEEDEMFSKDTGLKNEIFPIIDTINNNTKNLVYRAIIKLTNEEIQKQYNATMRDLQILNTVGRITYQVVIVQVDNELKYKEHGHYTIGSILM